MIFCQQRHAHSSSTRYKSLCSIFNIYSFIVNKITWPEINKFIARRVNYYCCKSTSIFYAIYQVVFVRRYRRNCVNVVWHTDKYIIPSIVHWVFTTINCFPSFELLNRMIFFKVMVKFVLFIYFANYHVDSFTILWILALFISGSSFLTSMFTPK